MRFKSHSRQHMEQVSICCVRKLRNFVMAFVVTIFLFSISCIFLAYVGLNFSVVQSVPPSAVIYNNMDYVLLQKIYLNNHSVDQQKTLQKVTNGIDISSSSVSASSIAPLPVRVRRTPFPPAVIRAVPIMIGSFSANDSLTVIQHTEQCRYLPGRSRTDGRWYNFTTEGYPFYAYSAILDTRSSLLTAPVLRIIALTIKFEDVLKENRSKLFCALHYETGTEFVPFENEPRAIGYGWPINAVWYKEYVYSCPLIHVNKLPRAVSVVPHVGDIINSCLPIDIIEKPATKQDFAICVQVSYDSPNPYQIIEWMELQKLLGVSRVGIYVMNVKDPAMKVFKHYAEAAGFVDLRFTESIGRSQQQYLLHGSPVINDCMYRYMYSFNRIVVIDFDEIIMPLTVNNLQELVTILDKSHTNASFIKPLPINYVFNNNYFFLDLLPDINESPFFTFMRFTKRVSPSHFGYSVKSIVDPEGCLVMHNHHCWAVTPGCQDRPFIVQVNTSLALNQHYKKCHLQKTECSNLTTVIYEDTTVSRFKPVLKPLVREKISLILRHNI